jgi:hypothetical protein
MSSCATQEEENKQSSTKREQQRRNKRCRRSLSTSNREKKNNTYINSCALSNKREEGHKVAAVPVQVRTKTKGGQGLRKEMEEREKKRLQQQRQRQVWSQTHAAGNSLCESGAARIHNANKQRKKKKGWHALTATTGGGTQVYRYGL